MPSAQRKTYSDLTPLEWQVWYVVTDLDDRRAYPTTRRVCEELPAVRRSSVRGARMRLFGWGLVRPDTPAPPKAAPTPKPTLRVVRPPEPFTGQEPTLTDRIELAALLATAKAENQAAREATSASNLRTYSIAGLSRTPLDRMAAHAFDHKPPRAACRSILRQTASVFGSRPQ